MHADQLAHVKKGCLARSRDDVRTDGSRIEGSHAAWNRDIVTAYSVIPGREDVALFLEEAMRGEGWEDSRMSLKRQNVNERLKESSRRQSERSTIQRVLDLDQQWWGQDKDGISSEEPSKDERDIDDVQFYVRIQ